MPAVEIVNHTPVWRNVVMRVCVKCHYATEARGLTKCPKCGWNGNGQNELEGHN